MKLKLAPDLVLDTDDDRVQKQGLRIGAVGESGAGKSHLIALIAEQCKQQGLQLVFFDTHGEYWTFSEVFEDILVVGGDNGDLPLDKEAVDVYAEAYRQGKSLDFSFKEIFTDDELYAQTVEKILRALWKVQVNEPRPCLWILEEAQLLCPQEKSFDTVRRVGLVKSIATGGRKFGVALILSTQRPAELHKTPLSQCWIRFFGKLTETLDKKAVQPYFKPLSSDKLDQLRTGQFWLYGWEKTPVMYDINPKRLTRHGGDTILLAPIARKTTAVTGSIKTFREQIEQMLKSHVEEKSEIQSLKSKLASQERQLEELQRKADVAQVIKDSLSRTVIADDSEGTITKVAKVDEATMHRLEQLGNLEAELTTTKEQLADARKEISELQPYVELKLVMTKIMTEGQPAPAVDPMKPEWALTWLSKMKGPAKKILQFLVEHPGEKFTKSDVARATGYSAEGGAFYDGLRVLRINGIIYHSGDEVRLKR
jgi:archaellum component FlaC